MRMVNTRHNCGTCTPQLWHMHATTVAHACHDCGAWKGMPRKMLEGSVPPGFTHGTEEATPSARRQKRPYGYIIDNDINLK